MAMKSGVPWTIDEDEVLQTMAAAKRSAFLIAAKLKRSISSIQRRGSELGVRIETPAATRRKTRATSGSEGEHRGRQFH